MDSQAGPKAKDLKMNLKLDLAAFFLRIHKKEEQRQKAAIEYSPSVSWNLLP
jgi:hypothetical protein